MLCPSPRFGKQQTSLRCVVAGIASERRDSHTELLTARAQFQALEAGGDVEADLALHAERLQRDRIVGAADQHIAAEADTDRGAALRTGVGAGEVARSEPVYRREHTPGECRFLGDAEVEADLANGRDVTVV